LLTVGSIMQYARDGDRVWGSGVNGKVPVGLHTFDTVDVRAVRGPLTAEFLRARGIPVPDVYGDPALLLPAVHPHLTAWAADKRYDVTVVPNMRDAAALSDDPRVVSPTAPLEHVLERIARSRMVVGSSLHGLVVAEALGIPARAVASRAEHPWKYEDYYLGTGRRGFTPAAGVDEAIAMGGEVPLAWDPLPLARAFPWDLWGRDVTVDAWFVAIDDRS
jgi:pyruvyltransferase